MTTDHLYLPARAGKIAIEEYERRAKNPTILDWGIPEFDEYVISPMAGDTIAFLARPGHGKTTHMLCLIKRWNELIKGTNKVLVVSSWETLIEEFVAILTSEESGQHMRDIGAGKADLVKIKKSVAKMILSGNIAMVGRSSERDYRGKAKASSMHTLEDLDRGLSELVSTGREPAVIFGDYLQRIPGRKGQDRQEAVAENADVWKDLAICYSCPAVVLVQAKRDVDSYKGLKMPTLQDPQWSSVIEQSYDKVFGQTRPILYMEKGEEIEDSRNGQIHEVSTSSFAIKVLKQRWAQAGRTFVLSLDPKSCTIGPGVYNKSAY